MFLTISNVRLRMFVYFCLFFFQEKKKYVSFANLSSASSSSSSSDDDDDAVAVNVSSTSHVFACYFLLI